MIGRRHCQASSRSAQRRNAPSASSTVLSPVNGVGRDAGAAARAEGGVDDMKVMVRSVCRSMRSTIAAAVVVSAGALAADECSRRERLGGPRYRTVHAEHDLDPVLAEQVNRPVTHAARDHRVDTPLGQEHGEEAR